YGLSYTSFSFSEFSAGNGLIKPGSILRVTVDVMNTGKRTGDEVVQLYIRHLNSTVTRPQKELKAFQRITLKPGEKKKVFLELKADDLRFWDENRKQFLLEKDKIDLMLGNSSDNIKFIKALQVVDR
ncbi:MAG: fibronectin type III-like domain-contianing protein, partial [Flavisolibacter sp.]